MAEQQMKLFPSGLDSSEIQAAVGFEVPYRGRQVYEWTSRGVAGFEFMSNLPAIDRQKLVDTFVTLRSSSVSSELEDADGSLKLQIRLRDGSAVECVLLEDIEGRKTACLSSQVGCPMGCTFCQTGKLGYLRNLGPDEILEQFHFLRERRGFISNVVFMGMGEPLLNLEAVRKAIRLISDPEGIGMSHRKITISTSGVVPAIRELADSGPRVRLAVSLTAADNELRTELMPINKTWNLSTLKTALLYYQAKTGDRITLEVALMGDRNVSEEDARALVKWVGKLRAQVNLIPWNAVPGLPYVEPTALQLRRFSEIVDKAGLVTVQRMHRGRGVMGACGQLGDTLTTFPSSIVSK